VPRRISIAPVNSASLSSSALIRSRNSWHVLPSASPKASIMTSRSMSRWPRSQFSQPDQSGSGARVTMGSVTCMLFIAGESYCPAGAPSITFAGKILRSLTRLLAERLFFTLQMAWGWGANQSFSAIQNHQISLKRGRGFRYVGSWLRTRIGGCDLINVRFVSLCGLKSDISRGPRSATTGREQMQETKRAANAAIRSPRRRG
jgi:hypothetical protein